MILPHSYQTRILGKSNYARSTNTGDLLCTFQQRLLPSPVTNHFVSKHLPSHFSLLQCVCTQTGFTDVDTTKDPSGPNAKMLKGKNLLVLLPIRRGESQALNALLRPSDGVILMDARRERLQNERDRVHYNVSLWTKTCRV